MSRFAGYALRLQLRLQVVKCVFGRRSSGGALQVKHVVTQENCRVKQLLPSFFCFSPTSTPIFCLIKLFLVLDSNKFALLIDGCWLVAMETVFPLEFMIDNEIPVPVTLCAQSIPKR